jgi:hypothetical protein
MIWAEWVKFRTLPGRVAALAASGLVVVLLGCFAAAGSYQDCMGRRCPPPPTGPGGQAVRDRFAFGHRPLTGDGEITAHVSSMSGVITYPPPGHDQIVAGLVPWAKAGIMVKAGTRPGDTYASVLLTGHEGVRMQADFAADVAVPGFSGEAWLRLRRAGDRVSGYASADGVSWRQISTVRLAGLPRTAQVGVFVTSPSDVTQQASPHGGHLLQARFTQATASFDRVTPGGPWRYDLVGDDGQRTDLEKIHPPGVTESAGILTVTGSGDIAPLGTEGGQPIERSLTGMFMALIIVAVIGVQFATSEHRRGLLRTTYLASPRRERVVAAKALVLGGATFAAGVLAAAVTLPLAGWMLEAHGVYLLPVSGWTTVRVVLGAGALLSATALIAYGIGTVTRRSLAAVVLAVVLLVVPQLLATTSVLPGGAASWLLRVTPAAGLALQQSIPAYPQVAVPYGVIDGYFPLPAWGGLLVLLGWAAVALVLGVARTVRADA